MPLVSPVERPLCLINISFAESVAAGEPVSFAPAFRAGFLSRLMPERITSSLAVQSAMLVGRTAVDVSSLIDTFRDRTLLEDSRRNSIMEQLNRASTEAETEARNAASRTSDDVRLIEEAFEHDNQIMARLATLEGQNWFGLPIDASENGPFGRLWPAGAPGWYIQLPSGGINPTITAGDTTEEAIAADIVCWHLSPEGRNQAWTVQGIISSIRSRVAESNRSRAPQIFVVHAPGLSDSETVQLVMAGATVLAEARIADVVPRSTSEFINALEQQIAQGYRGWSLERGLWRYLEGYIEGSATPEFGVLSEADFEVAQAASDQESYESVIRASRSLEDRLRSESGWPIDI